MNNYFIEPELNINPEERQRASYLRKEVVISKEIKCARLIMSACGVYKGYLNGAEVDKQCFLPGFTSYRKRLQYQEYDVTDMLHMGCNVLGAIVGDGWYRGRIGLYEQINYYGTKTKFLCVLTITYKDGTEELVVTDLSWKATQEGAIGENDLKGGEKYDATQEMDGWNKAGFDDSEWHGVVLSSYEGELVPSEGALIIEQEVFKPQVLKTPDGNTVLDFGQNISGYVRFKVNGKKGEKVKMTHGETLDEHGNFTLKNLQLEGELDNKVELGEAFGQVIEYTLKEGEQTYKPTFAVSGFQYVKIENWPEKVVADNFEAIAVYSDINVDASFTCSNPLINKLVENVAWSERGNFLDIPTDCPTRERAGWGGDIAVFVETACYLSDPKRFLEKWMVDVALDQGENGIGSFMVPDMGLGDMANGAAGWADVLYIVPVTLYKYYGDKTILEKYYDNIKRWVEFNRRRAKDKHADNAHRQEAWWDYILDTGFHFGEWLEPGAVMTEDAALAMSHPDAEVATAYFAYSAKTMAEIAGILGRKDDEKEYSVLFETICEAYAKAFLEDGRVKSHRMCRYVRPVQFDLVPVDIQKTIVEDLNKMVIDNNYRIGTGFLTTPQILSVLTKFGYIDTAYKMLENTTQPGWLYAVTKGATTIWENWYGKDENNVPRDSMNHYSPGSVVAWLFKTVAGITAEEAGFKTIKIKPIPGGTLNFAKAKINTCRGTIVSDWQIQDSKFALKVSVPEKAIIVLPNNEEYQVDPGEHEFFCEIR